MKRFVLLGAVVAGALFAGSRANADPRQAANAWQAPTTMIEERGVFGSRGVRQGGGAGLFAASYIPSVIVAAASSREDGKRLFIPAAGPWLDPGGRDCEARPCGNNTLTGAFLWLGGVAQAMGVIGFVGGTLRPA